MSRDAKVEELLCRGSGEKGPRGNFETFTSQDGRFSAFLVSKFGAKREHVLSGCGFVSDLDDHSRVT